MSEQDIQKLVADHAALQNENAVLKEELAELQQQMAWLKKQMLGRKTEQTSTIMDGGTQLSLFGDAQPESAPVQEETVTVPEQDRRMRSKKICPALFNWAWKGVFH